MISINDDLIAQYGINTLIELSVNFIGRIPFKIGFVCLSLMNKRRCAINLMIVDLGRDSCSLDFFIHYVVSPFYVASAVNVLLH